MANSYGWPDPKVTYNKNAKKIDAARAARAAQVGQLHQPMPMAPVSSVMPPMGMGSLPLSMQPQTIAAAQGKPWPPVQPPVPGFRGGGIVRFDDGGDVELSDEEKQRQAQMNAGDVPVPSTQGTYGPPAPTYLQAAQQVFAQNPELVSIAAGEMQANNGVANIQQYQQQVQQQQAQQQQYDNRQSGVTQVNPVQGGFRSNENPTNVQPGVNADAVTGLLGGIGSVYNKLNPDIPYVSPAVRAASPYIGEAINSGGALPALANRGLEAVGAPGAVRLPGPYDLINRIGSSIGAPSVGQFTTDQTIGHGGALDLGLAFGPELFKGAGAARTGIENAAVKGLEFKPQGLEALGGREAASAQLKGGLPAGAALTPQEGQALRAQAEAAGITAEDWQSSTALLNQYGKTGADGAVARAKQALEAIGERTVGSPSEVLKRYDNAGAQIFPELGEAQHRINNMAGNAYQDAIAKGGSLEDAKAAAKSAAKAQQGVEEAVPNPQIQAQNQAGGYEETLQKALEAKGVTASPPPSSLTPEEIGNTMRQADVNAGFGDLDAGKLPTPAEITGVSNLTGDARVQAMEQAGNTAQPRELSPEAQAFLNSPAGQASAAQRTEAMGQGITPGEVNAVGGTPPPASTGGGTTGGTGGADELKPQNPVQQVVNLISVPTQTRLLGGHMLRQGEGTAITHPAEAVNALRAGFREFTKPGQANQIVSDIRARGAALPEGMRLQDVRGTAGPRMEKGIGDKLLGQIPLFDRVRGLGTTYLNTLRDGIYVTTAERHLRMDPEAPPEALKAIYNTLSHQTGHPTLKGNVKETMGNVQGLGVGWGALTARVQHFGDVLLAPGSPLPWSPTAKGEAVRGLLGNIGTMVASTTAASYLGAQVNVPFLGGQRDLTNPYGIRTDFFKPTTLTPDMAFKTVYGTGGSGYDAILRLFGNAAIDLANGDKGQLTTHVLNWARGEVGVAPSVLIDLLSGSTYNGKPYDLEALKQEASGGFLDRIAPIAAESMWNAYHAWGPEGLVRAAPSLGAWEVQTTPTTKTNQGNALLNSDNRDQLLGPTLAPLVKPGEDFNALGSREKEAIHAGMNPEALKAERDQKIKDGDQVAIAQFQREDIKSSYQPAFQKLEQELKAGTYTPYEIRQLTNATERQMYEKMNGVKFPEPSKDYTPSPIQKAEEGYRSLYDALPKAANGKPDYDQLQHAQQAYMANIGKNDPELMQRLAANVLPRVNPNDSNIQKMYDQPEMKAAVKAYNSVDDGAKTGFRIENPQQNALLYSGGYVRTLDTPAAVEAFKAMGIAGEPQVNFAVGFTKDTATPYSRIQAGSLQPQLQQYQGLNASREEGDFRAQAYLQAHPALNALLWQTGHTSHVYSMDAYNAITQHHDPPLTGGRGNAVQAPAQPTGATLPPVVSNDTQQRQNFVQAMAGPAEQYAQATKIPPAVWAAMGASESNWGRAQSIFGIMGQGTAGGKNYDTFEIRPGGVKENTNSQFAAYNTLDDAFKHFTDLTSSGRYAPAWNNLQQTGDWQEFLHGINKAGYATAPNWADSIISLSKHIEDNYGLSR